MKKYNKLVRDKIPEIIKADGGKCNFHVANKEEFEEKLKEKLLEEVIEFNENPCAEEIADILEVIEMLGRVYGISLVDIRNAKAFKRIDRGGFSKMIILEKATEIKG